MFTKLLKHEFKTVGKTLCLLSIAALIAGAIGGLLVQVMITNIQIESGEMLSILSVLLLSGIYFALAAYIIGSFIMLYYRFYKNKFTDEGYLTFTLPVSTHQILLSTIVNNLIWSAITYTVFFISIVFMIMPVFFIEEAKPVFQELFTLNNLTSQEANLFSKTFGEIGIMWLCGIVYSSILPLFSITVGSIVAKKYKVLVSIGIGYGISMAVSVLTSFLTIAEMTVNSQFFTNFENMGASTLLPSLLMLFLGIGGYFLMHHLIDKKLNL